MFVPIFTDGFLFSSYIIHVIKWTQGLKKIKFQNLLILLGLTRTAFIAVQQYCLVFRER